MANFFDFGIVTPVTMSNMEYVVELATEGSYRPRMIFMVEAAGSVLREFSPRLQNLQATQRMAIVPFSSYGEYVNYLHGRFTPKIKVIGVEYDSEFSDEITLEHPNQAHYVTSGMPGAALPDPVLKVCDQIIKVQASTPGAALRRVRADRYFKDDSAGVR